MQLTQNFAKFCSFSLRRGDKVSQPNQAVVIRHRAEADRCEGQKTESLTMGTTRVLIVIATFFPIPGGAEKQALEQGRVLRQKGLETTIVTFRHNSAWAANETIDGVPVIRVAGLLLGRRERFPRVLQKALYFVALIAMGCTVWHYRHRYDVLHVYQLGLLALPTAIACYFSGKPMVVAVRCADSSGKDLSQRHNSLTVGPLAADGAMMDVRGEAREKGDLEDLARLGKPVVRFTRFLLQRINAVVIVLSTRMLTSLSSHNFTFSEKRKDANADFPGPQPILIPNGVDTSRFYPRSADTPQSQTVVCTSRLSYQKGIDVLLKAWQIVHAELPEARLIIAGIGHLQAQLAHMAQELDLGKSVQFVGLQSDVVAVLHQGSIATLPSRWEGMPNAILEAMACGLPCVATRVSGAEDVITHEVDGLLVEPEDPRALASALLTLLHDPMRRSAYGMAAREVIEQKYAIELITERYVDIYESIAGVSAITRAKSSLGSPTVAKGLP